MLPFELRSGGSHFPYSSFLCLREAGAHQLLVPLICFFYSVFVYGALPTVVIFTFAAPKSRFMEIYSCCVIISCY
jgi:hypothetical protein